jgi:hypothetical protein
MGSSAMIVMLARKGRFYDSRLLGSDSFLVQRAFPVLVGWVGSASYTHHFQKWAKMLPLINTASFSRLAGILYAIYIVI